ncbi:CubicO group peptidase (beta-lactamase class C family) [Stella humosa]|uniref:CubicO group peptidase (Beta-lactamase class C family) n=1 Tax=Stella humosa TaxID=94 RepID=A0A3N1L573_9PROT|nr:serine hydrolase [Stella humosa]ROP84535.1 CubicO group peptidase (beta-lactamase class C family) [Stella humosa]BBK34055.1 hypothetical protein STHU_46890 [Stella humosa]
MTRPTGPFFDRTPLLMPARSPALPRPYVFDARPRALRGKVVAFLAKRYVDMLYVTGLSRTAADGRIRLRAIGQSGDLTTEPDLAPRQAELEAAWKAGAIAVAHDDGDRRVTVTWTDPAFGEPVRGSAIARPGYGGIVLGERAELAFEPTPIRRAPAVDGPWGKGAPAGSPALERAIDGLLSSSPGIYGVLVATPESILAERYGAEGAPDRPTPSWSMTKAVTATLIGRLIQEGWLGSVYDPAPAPLWTDPRDVHRLITLDHLLRMRSGLAFQAVDEKGEGALYFENNFVYYNGEDAFDTAQRAIVATLPGSTYRYMNTGLNVLGAIIRDRIEARGLPYHETVYGLLADRIGMAGYQHSADCVGNFIGSGSGAGTLRDYGRFGALFLQDGVWDGQRLLPEGWVDYVTSQTHVGSEYAACFRSNVNGTFPSLPADTVWASGASDQRIILLRRQRVAIVVTNETEHPMDLAALDGVGRAVLDL